MVTFCGKCTFFAFVLWRFVVGTKYLKSQCPSTFAPNGHLVFKVIFCTTKKSWFFVLQKITTYLNICTVTLRSEGARALTLRIYYCRTRSLPLLELINFCFFAIFYLLFIGAQGRGRCSRGFGCGLHIAGETKSGNIFSSKKRHSRGFGCGVDIACGQTLFT